MALRWELISPAKINLGLRVLYRLENGYHYLLTPMAAVSLSDILLVEESNEFSLSLRLDLPSPFCQGIEEAFRISPNGGYKNILYKTYQILKDKLDAFRIPPLHITVVKKIPSPSGLGGASSNAAQLLLFFNQWLKLPEEELISSALQIGADVPFFLKPKPALVENIGERKYDLILKNFIGFLGVPAFGFSTREMYSLLKKDLQDKKNAELVRKRAIRELGREMGWLLAEGVDHPAELATWEKVEKPDKVCYLTNDFWQVTCQKYPQEAGELWEAQELVANLLWQNTGKPVASGISGSGPAVFAITEGVKCPNLQSVLTQKKPTFLWYPIEGLI